MGAPPPPPEQCEACKHFRGLQIPEHLPADVAGMEDLDDYVCDAFPDGIPEEIAGGTFDHRNAFPGDRGIRLEPMTWHGPYQIRKLIECDSLGSELE